MDKEERDDCQVRHHGSALQHGEETSVPFCWPQDLLSVPQRGCKS